MLVTEKSITFWLMAAPWAVACEMVEVLLSVNPRFVVAPSPVKV